jgi:type VI secretion system secreted protein Hcp
MALYVQFDTIPGNVTTTGWEKWIEVTSFQWGTSRGIGTAARGSTSRESSEPSVSEIVVTKPTDVASTKLWRESVGGLLNHKVVISFTTTNANNPVEYLNLELTNTAVSSYSISSGGDIPMESITFNFTKVMFKFSGMDPGVTGSPDTVGFDLATMTTM